MTFSIGDKVRYSGYALQGSRDWWQSQGHEPQKSRAKDSYLAKCAERGTITEILHNGVEVKWDNGSISRCLTSQVDKA